MKKKAFGLLAALLAATAAASEESWLDAEVRAQEARWDAQREKTAPLQPVGYAARWLSEQAKSEPPGARSATAERAVRFTGLAARAVAPPTVAAPAYAPPAGRAGDYGQTILDLAARHRLDPLLIRAVMLAESAGNRRALSPKGAIGLMQLMPATARRFGVDPRDPHQNIAGGARYLRWLLDYFGGDVRLALAGYNAGEKAVDRHGGVPPYRETQNYVRRVQGFHRALLSANGR